MKTTFTDSINIVFMLISMVLAILIPFELFLFVYAFLGPLHYLTEINWLHQKNFYLPKKNDYFIILTCLFFITICWFLNFRIGIPYFIFLAFTIPIGLILFTDTIKRILSVLFCVIVGFLLFYFILGEMKLFFSIFLPTLIHVFLFTGAFILLGALKAKSKIGFLSIFIFITCSLLLFIFTSAIHFSEVNNYITHNYSSFTVLNKQIISFLNTSEIQLSDSVFHSETGIKVMRFIAFAYTYHYLNWFSKTSVIQWHKTSKIKLIVIFIIWILSIGLYAYDYKLALGWLYILSLSHVLLEFPLNHISFLEIKKQLLSLYRN